MKQVLLSCDDWWISPKYKYDKFEIILPTCLWLTLQVTLVHKECGSAPDREDSYWSYLYSDDDWRWWLTLLTLFTHTHTVAHKNTQCQFQCWRVEALNVSHQPLLWSVSHLIQVTSSSSRKLLSAIRSDGHGKSKTEREEVLIPWSYV